MVACEVSLGRVRRTEIIARRRRVGFESDTPRAPTLLTACQPCMRRAATVPPALITLAAIYKRSTPALLTLGTLAVSSSWKWSRIRFRKPRHVQNRLGHRQRENAWHQPDSSSSSRNLDFFVEAPPLDWLARSTSSVLVSAHECRRKRNSLPPSRRAMTSVNFPVFLVGWSTRVVRRARYWPTLGARVSSTPPGGATT